MIAVDRLKKYIEALPEPNTVPLGHKFVFPYNDNGLKALTFITVNVRDNFNPVAWALETNHEKAKRSKRSPSKQPEP